MGSMASAVERFAFPLLLVFGEDLDGIAAEGFGGDEGVLDAAGYGEVGTEHLYIDQRTGATRPGSVVCGVYALFLSDAVVDKFMRLVEIEEFDVTVAEQDVDAVAAVVFVFFVADDRSWNRLPDGGRRRCRYNRNSC